MLGTRMKRKPQTQNQENQSSSKWFVVYNYDGSSNFSVYVAETREEAIAFIKCESMKYNSILGCFNGRFFRDVTDLEDERENDEPINVRQNHDISHEYKGERY